MGEVFRARDTKLLRDVAIKVLPETLASDPERRARFEREAQVLASLNHPNIGSIHGLEEGPSDGQPAQALILELVEGPTLADRIVQGPIPLDEAAAHCAADRGCARGSARTGDRPSRFKAFQHQAATRRHGQGARLRPGEAGRGPYRPGAAHGNAALSQSPTITSPAMTLSGVILGTAAYMSPEQARGL